MLKEIDVTIPSDNPKNRDKGKTYRIREMPAEQAEWWAIRACFAVGKHLMIDNEGGFGMGALYAAFVKHGWKALFSMDPEDAKILFDEMMECVKYVPDPKHATITRAPMHGDIEEVSTRLRLRGEVFTLHTGFSLPGGRSTT